MVEQNYRSSISADAEEGGEVVRAQAVHLQAAEVEEQARSSLQGLAGERSTVSLFFNHGHLSLKIPNIKFDFDVTFLMHVH